MVRVLGFGFRGFTCGSTKVRAWNTEPATTMTYRTQTMQCYCGCRDDDDDDDDDDDISMVLNCTWTGGKHQSPHHLLLQRQQEGLPRTVS